jgi:Rieske Fe-S protein
LTSSTPAPAPAALATRRAFVCGTARAIAGGVIAGAAAPLVEACTGGRERPKPHAFEATVDLSGLTDDQGALVTSSIGPDGAPILVVRKSSREFGAFSMLCTHEGCPLKPPVAGLITCPCHGSQFDLDGKVRRGPAELPLLGYSTAYDVRARRLTVFSDG